MSDSEDEISVKCYLCGKVEEKTSRIIECVQCNRSVHLKCKGLIGNAVTKARKKPFYCSAECIDIQQRVDIAHKGMNEFVQKLNEVSLFMQEAKLESSFVRTELGKTRSEIASLMETSKSVEASQVFISSEFEELKAALASFKQEIIDLKVENSALKLEVEEWGDKYALLNRRCDQLELDLDKVNRTSVSQNAVVMGVPNAANEDVKRLVLDVCVAMHCEIDESDVLRARRLSGKNNNSEASPILVSFSSTEVKNRLMERKQAFGALLAPLVNRAFVGSKKRITIRDELTNFGRELLREVKEMQEELNIKYVWPGRDGKILVRRYEGAKVEQIGSKQELRSLGKTIYKRTLDPNNTSSDHSSPSPKRINSN